MTEILRNKREIKAIIFIPAGGMDRTLNFISSSSSANTEYRLGLGGRRLYNAYWSEVLGSDTCSYEPHIAIFIILGKLLYPCGLVS